MRACAVTSLVVAIAVAAALSAAACGGGASAAPRAAAPTGEASVGAAPGSPERTPEAAAAPASDSAPTAGAASPRALGAGDTRTMESIAALVKTHRKEARDCYEKALKQIPGLKGDVVIHFTLKPNGAVKQAELNDEKSTIREASVSSCVIDVIRAITFPRSSKGLETSVNYPFNFNP